MNQYAIKMAEAWCDHAALRSQAKIEYYGSTVEEALEYAMLYLWLAEELSAT